MSEIKNILVTGGAGYVGAVLVPTLLEGRYRVKVLDLYIYDDDVLDDHEDLVQVKGDIRDRKLLEREIPGTDAIIHLACISNDPSFDLDPELGKSINSDAFTPLVDIAKRNKVRRFIFASSASVYGVKKEAEVTEDLIMDPITDYALYKAECEKILFMKADDDFIITIIRPATVCGYSPRMRLDLTVNILTNHAVNRGEITVFGGEQMRPSIHIEDMANLYKLLLEVPEEKVQRKTYNAGWENHRVIDLAEIVQRAVGGRITITVKPSDDNRSYRICSRKIEDELFVFPAYTIEDAVLDMRWAYRQGWIPNPMDDDRYYNVRTMRAKKLR